MAERLSVLDASFLYLETPDLHMHVGGLGVYDPTHARASLTLQRLRDLMASRLHLVPRFHQKVVFPPLGSGRPVWVEAVDLDLDYHLRRVVVQPPGGPRELAALSGEIHSQPLDRGKPLWQMYLIDGLADGYQATLTKTHHAVLDGLGGMDVIAVLLDHTPDPPALSIRAWQPERVPSTMELLRDALRDRAAEPAGALARTAVGAIRHPREAIKGAAKVLEGTARMLAAGPAPRSPFNTAVGASRRFAMTEISLEEARAIKRSLGGTVNDLILAVVAGALQRVLEDRREPVQGRTLRSMMPESIRTAGDQPGQGNRVTSFFVDLPVGPMDAAERLRRVSMATRRLKTSHQDEAATALLSLAIAAPPPAHATLMRLGQARQRIFNLVVSNIPGPQIPLFLDGARLVAYYPLMPLAANAALSVGIVTLVGVMGFGFTADPVALPDLEPFATYTRDAFDEFKKAAGV